MDDAIFATIKNVGIRKLSKPMFNWEECWSSCVMWLFGGVLALMPSLLHFFMRPLSELTAAKLFGNPGVLYTSITMAVIALCSNMRHVGPTFTAFYILLIVIGTMAYTSLECGFDIPVFSGDGFYIFNVILLAFVVIIGLGMFVWGCYKKGGEV